MTEPSAEEARQTLVDAIWTAVVDSSSMGIVMNGPIKTALVAYRAAVEAEVRKQAAEEWNPLVGQAMLVEREIAWLNRVEMIGRIRRRVATMSLFSEGKTMADAAEVMRNRCLAIIAEEAERG